MATSTLGFVVLGVCTGILSGFFGVGGGVVMVPALVFFFHYNQLQAQGTSLLAMMIPVNAIAVYLYYQKSPFPIKSSLLIALGILLGSWIGVIAAHQLPIRAMRLAFGVLMIGTALKLMFSK